MTNLRTLLGKLIESNYAGTNPSGVTPTVFWDDEFREMDGFAPLIKVYLMSTHAIPKGLGYSHRKVMHRATVDIKCRDSDVCYDALQTVLGVLGRNCVSPWPGYSHIEYDDGVQHAGYSGFYWWTVELKIWQPRKPTGQV